MRPTLPALLLLSGTLATAQKAASPKPPTDSAEHQTGIPGGRSLSAGVVQTSLPVTSVSLYKNGVGFFEHTGRIDGNAAVNLSFTNAQLNDVLQTLTAIDLNGGRIAGAGYNSTTPLDQQLKNLPLALGEDPTAIEFYNAVRGARVEVHAGTISITGRLLSMEERTTPTAADDSKPGTVREFITVVSDSGEVRTLELTAATSVRLLDTALHTDVNRYLQLLDSTRNQGLRHLTLEDHGTGPRGLKLSYLSEVPIWKSTYRILFTDAGKSISTQTATLQGWSVVDNTTGTDWINVHLSLIAGAPQSFIQPLSQPIYSRRPEIPIAQEAQLTPQTHDSSIDSLSANETVSVNAAAPQMAMKARSVHGLSSVAAGVSLGSGFGGGIGGGFAAPPPQPTPSYEDAANASLATNTTTAAFDDYFAYNLTEPVTILKNESALVPILQARVAADRVTLVSSNGTNTSQPLRALWITNTSGLTLDRGSFSIVENGNFGGEGLLDPIHAGEKRLLSYAADQAVHVTVEDLGSNNRITRISSAKGVLSIHRSEADHITYVFHNSAADARSIVLEHPVQRGLKLDPTPAPTETTPTVVRYRVEAAPGETTRLRLTGSRASTTSYQLTSSDDNQLTFILNSTDHNPALEAALLPVLEARRRVSDAQTAVNQTTDKLTALRSDEERQRSNITALATADKSSRDRFVKDLNHTEDEIASAQAELTTRTTTLNTAKADLAQRIESLQINETL